MCTHPRPFLVLLAVAITTAPASAQRIVDLRSATAPPPVTITDRCLTVGDGQNGRPEGLLGVSSATRVRGSIYIANLGTGEILVYDSTGAFVRAFARFGTGPGELSRSNTGDLMRVRLARYRGDSIIVFDAMQTRATIFGPRGEVGRVFRVDSLHGLRRQITLVGNADTSGGFSLYSSVIASRPAGQSFSGEVVFYDTLGVVRYDANGRALWASPRLESGVHASMVENVVNRTANGVSASGRSGPSFSRPTSRSAPIALAAGHVFHYSETANILQAFDARGTKVLEVRLPAMPVPPPAGPGNPVQSLIMFGDDAGNVWLPVPRTTPGIKARDWWVISSTGAFVRNVRSLSNALPLFITATHIGLRAVDSDGVEVVKVCPLPQ